MKAFLTHCAARASHSLMAVALLFSQAFGGVLSGAWGSFEKLRKKIIFC